MKFGKCRLCLKDKNLVYSHIFSEFLYKPIYENNHTYTSVLNPPPYKTKQFQKGMREYLLCENCDGNIIHDYENYAATLFKKIEKQSNADLSNIIIKEFDYRRFKLFGLSLLWRCHISNLPMFDSVDITPHAEKIRKLLLYGNSTKPREYCVVISKIVGTESAPTVITPPTKCKLRSYNHYIFMAYGYRWVIILSSSLKGLIQKIPLLGLKDELLVHFTN